MEIKIDTKKDSPEDIKKTIEFLQRMIEASSSQNSNEAIPDAGMGAFNMFGEDNSSSTPSSYEAEKKEDDDDTPPMTIVEY